MFNLYRKLIGEVPMTYNGIGVGTAIAISAGTSAVTAKRQGEAQEEAAQEQQRLQAEAQQQEQDIMNQQALQNAQDQEQQTIEFGVDEEEGSFGSYDDFITKTPSSTSAGLGGTNNATGLGF